MSFFERNRARLAERGIDPERLPPGQYATERFPTLSAAEVPDVDLDAWDFTVGGLVGTTHRWTWQEFRQLPSKRVVADIHCVTKWSKFDTKWTGIRVRDIWERISASGNATHVLVKAYHGYTANLPVDDFLADARVVSRIVERYQTTEG